jgi:6-phospho-beta-glucosidase
VEAPALVGRDGPAPMRVSELLPHQRTLISRVKEVERLTLRASAERSAELAVEALARHPVVDPRTLAGRIFAGYLARQPGFADLFD